VKHGQEADDAERDGTDVRTVHTALRRNTQRVKKYTQRMESTELEKLRGRIILMGKRCSRTLEKVCRYAVGNAAKRGHGVPAEQRPVCA
jgi:hypothetical protein